MSYGPAVIRISAGYLNLNNNKTMKTYYFTFGQSHYTQDGEPMKDHFIRVIAESYGKARELLITHFTSKRMEAPDKFSFQYDADEFERKWIAFFPKGEYLALHQLDYEDKVKAKGLSCGELQ